MNKPNGYDETKASSGEFTPVELGGHFGLIKGIEETASRSGSNMIIVTIDFDSHDAQPGYFNDMYQNDDRPEKKWPYQATQYIVTEDRDGKCSRSFKAFCTAYEDSNGTKINWNAGDQWARQFTNKKIGVVYGEVEEEYNGEVRDRRRIRWFCDYAKVSSQKVPKHKELVRNAAPVTESGSAFMPVTENGDSDFIPW